MPGIASATLQAPRRALVEVWRGRHGGIAQGWLSLAAYLVLALSFRAFLIGNPVVHVDEEFYLYAAQRWQEGALPYVGVWDRKPIGLFALYRLFVMAPGGGLVAYQLAGIVFTALTALVVERMAKEIAPPRAAWLAGAAYVLYMPVFNCALGQGPVFYNLPVALAALTVMEAWKRPNAPDLLARGVQAMALVGIAMQIKTCVVFEGMALGMMLLARGWADGWRGWRLAMACAIWAGIAILPMALALGAYAAAGHGEAFIQANFVSVFQRGPEGPVAGFRLFKETLALLPFILAILLAPGRMPMPWAHPVALRALRLWAAAAVLGFLAFGTWYDHYVAPMLAPLSVLAAPALARTKPGERWYGRLLLGFGAVAGLVVMVYQVHRHGNGQQVSHLASTVRSEIHGGCYFQFDGEPAFYQAVGACVPTRFAFPNHLTTYTEATAIGADPNVEVARIMLSRPDVVQVAEWKKIYLPNHISRAVLMDFLQRNYEHYASVQVGERSYGLWRPKLRPQDTGAAIPTSAVQG